MNVRARSEINVRLHGKTMDRGGTGVKSHVTDCQLIKVETGNLKKKYKIEIYRKYRRIG